MVLSLIGGIVLLATPFALFSIIPLSYAGVLGIAWLASGAKGATVFRIAGYAWEATGIALVGFLSSLLHTLTLGFVDPSIKDSKTWRGKLFNASQQAGRWITLIAGSAAGFALGGASLAGGGNSPRL